MGQHHHPVDRLLKTIWVLLGIFVILVSGTFDHTQLGSPKAPNNLLRKSLPREKSDSQLFPKNVHSEAWNGGYRLPTSLKPVHYVVRLQPFINGNSSIIGDVAVNFEVLEATSNITMNAFNINVFSETLKVTPADDPTSPGLEIADITYDSVVEMTTFRLTESLQPGQSYVFSTAFESYLYHDYFGFYEASYVDGEGNTVLLALTQFEATGARRAFPCFDEPSLKATFDIYLGHEDSMSAIANMPIIETIPIEGQSGWSLTHYETTVVMSPYLLAFVISDFASNTSTTDAGKPYGVWSRPQLIETTQYALDKGPDVLSFYENYLSMDYVLPKMDMVSSTDFFGAMENWGLIIYDEEAMLYDPVLDSEFDKQYVMQVVAHETAHQWFGNLVTTGWWSHLWLNEGYAEYMEYIGTNATEPSWNFVDRILTDEVQYTLDFDCMAGYSHPVVNEVESPSEIDYMFDVITYGKGASLNRMMNHMLTEATFVKALSNYINMHQYSNTFQDDLFEVLTTSAHEDGTIPLDMTIKQVMDTWTLQSGYPILTVTRTDQGTSASVNQRRFWCPDQDTSEAWWIPITYTSQDNPQFEMTQPMLWMSDSVNEITIDGLPTSDQWVIFNIQETGYYRVDYDENNWNLLMTQLDTDPDAIHHLNRAQILDDYFDITRAGLRSYETALQMLQYLPKEKSLLPWISALNNVDFLVNMIRTTEGWSAFQNYLLSLLVPLYNSMGFEDCEGMTQEELYKQMLANTWVCDLGHNDCIDRSVDMFNNWMEDPIKNSITPNMQQLVYRTAIAEGGDREWTFANAQYQQTKVKSQKKRIIDALGNSRNEATLLRHLEAKMHEKDNGGIMESDFLETFAWVAKMNPTGRTVAWNFLKTNAKFIAYKKNAAFGKMVKIVTETFNTEQEMTELRDFLSPFTDNENPDRMNKILLDQALETVNNNIAWMDTNYDVIIKWLKNNGY